MKLLIFLLVLLINYFCTNLMMKYIAFLIFAISTFSAYSQAIKVKKEFYTQNYFISKRNVVSDTVITKEYEVLTEDDYTKHGYYREYFLGKKIKVEGYYNMGKKTGVWKTYKDNDIMISAVEYKNGYKNGESKLFNDKGVLTFFAEYTNDILNGEYIKYDEFGNKIMNGYYTNGNSNGKWHYYNDKGDEYALMQYNNGALHDTSFSYLPDDKLFALRIYNEGKLLYQKFCDSTGYIYQTDSLVDNSYYIQHVYQNNQLYYTITHNDSTIKRITFNTSLYPDMHHGNFANGNGDIKLYDKEGNIEFYFVLKDNSVSGFKVPSLSEESIDTILYFDGKKSKCNILKEFSFLTYKSIIHKASYQNSESDYNMMKIISKNIRYPEYEVENGIQGEVVIGFVVNKFGDIIDPIILKSLTPACNNEVIRVLGLMHDWIPGTANGMPVNMSFTLPLEFRLQ